MDIELRKIKPEEKDYLSKMLNVYREEIFNKPLNELGPYKYLDKYFSEPNRIPLFILTNDEIAGFSLINLKDPLSNGEKQAISEFYIKPEFRKQKLGTIAAEKIFKKYPGEWVIRVLKENPAYHFWKKVISEFTDGRFKESVQNDIKWNGNVLSFSN